MAGWKKVVVSGSNVSQLNNDAGYLVSAGVNSFETFSVNGVSVVADSSTDTLTLASGSGAGLNISGNAGTDTITFTLGSIPNTSLANSTISGVALGGTLAALTAGSGLTNPGTFTGATARTISVDSGSMATYFNQTGFAGVSGDITISAGGIATIAANSVALGTDTTGNYVATLGSGTGVTIGSNTGEGSTPTISVVYGATSAKAVEGNTTISLSGTSGEIGVTGTTAQALGGGPSYTLTLPGTITGNRTFSNNVIVSGDLTVQGTASFQHTTNLQVADRFVLFASGSNTAGDGGIVVQQATQNVGELFGYENSINRWGFTSSFDASNPTYTAAAMVTTTEVGTITPSAAPLYGGSSNGHGNIYVKTDTGDIFIYA